MAAVVASPRFIAFLIASLILAVTPGPGVIFVVTRTLAQGRNAGLASVGGIGLGNFGNALLAAVGLAAVFAVSATAFVIVKFAGAAYLIFLGVKTLRTRSASTTLPRPRFASHARLFGDGFMVALLNPKTTLFFAAFLPQFIDPTASPLIQSVALGAIFVLIALCTDSTYALTASAMAMRLGSRSGLWPYARYVSAATFIGLGVLAALASPRSVR
jgi:threonine/homoserine/homoserine lactone efflux protein